MLLFNMGFLCLFTWVEFCIRISTYFPYISIYDDNTKFHQFQENFKYRINIFTAYKISIKSKSIFSNTLCCSYLTSNANFTD